MVVPSISSVSGTSTDEGINPLDDDVDIDVIDWCCPRCCDRVLIARIGRYLGAEFCLLGSGPFCAGFLLERNEQFDLSVVGRDSLRRTRTRCRHERHRIGINSSIMKNYDEPRLLAEHERGDFISLQPQPRSLALQQRTKAEKKS